ncbi:hypothetical protein [Planktotalea sp.]|uniref:hypothetical protein n=1 Tax=Planktotalea sp. TaxID=2029877 RepID=UPI0032992FF8
MNKKVFVASSWYDLAVSSPFALPFTLAFVWGGVMAPLHDVLGLSPLEALSPHSVLFANFFGSVVTIWATVRLYLADVRLAVFDGFGRMLFCIAMLNALMTGASPLIWFFFVPEFAFGALQITGYIVSMRRLKVA